MSFWDSKIVLITGGTGSLGTALSEQLLREPIAALRIFSRDEYKQAEWSALRTDPRVRMLLGDVRDASRLARSLAGVDVVAHCAALKRADAIEYNALEAVHTNITGSENVVNAAIDAKVAHACLISSDKAVRPTFIYGATKMIAEQLFLHPYTGNGGPTFSVCRLGNLLGSRESIVPLLREQAKTGTITITDPRMTRYVLTLREAARYVLDVIASGVGGLHVPDMRVIRLSDLVKAMAPHAKMTRLGARHGEKLHEQLHEDGRESSDGPFMSVGEIQKMLDEEGL